MGSAESPRTRHHVGTFQVEHVPLPGTACPSLTCACRALSLEPCCVPWRRRCLPPGTCGEFAIASAVSGLQNLLPEGCAVRAPPRALGRQVACAFLGAQGLVGGELWAKGTRGCLRWSREDPVRGLPAQDARNWSWRRKAPRRDHTALQGGAHPKDHDHSGASLVPSSVHLRNQQWAH